MGLVSWMYKYPRVDIHSKTPIQYHSFQTLPRYLLSC
ncbi:unnamed protein product [Schistosoma mattheei]|uniref:Uncharacterized protein n=1 Tax=Schistosoma mattheei TaxID=31246 RepID=A0A3P8FAS7_9TREM|nr:unnamed protein product [Schistosoma mattheei]